MIRFACSDGEVWITDDNVFPEVWKVRHNVLGNKVLSRICMLRGSDDTAKIAKRMKPRSAPTNS